MCNGLAHTVATYKQEGAEEMSVDSTVILWETSLCLTAKFENAPKALGWMEVLLFGETTLILVEERELL